MTSYNNRASVYIIAEAGVNHNGDEQRALAMVDAAADCGADAVKFQTFKAEYLVSANAPKAQYQKASTDAAESQLDMVRKLELTYEFHHKLQARARERGIDFISTAFELPSLKFLQTLDLPWFKIPSGEITNGPLLMAFARTQKPLILSTGMATLSDVETALAILVWGRLRSDEPKSLNDIWQHWSNVRSSLDLGRWVTLLHCTSQYPTPADEVNLLALRTLQSTFGVPVGYSDHTAGHLATTAAVALGATVIEKHFTLDRALPGPDHQASMDLPMLQDMVERIRELEVMLSHGMKVPQPSEWDTRQVARQHLIAAKPISAGEPFSMDNVRTARTGGGMSPVHYWDVLGTRAKRNFALGEVIGE
ncbi:N-acetylneuraminate synthase [Salinispirillum marinum]|uniref:N-acetylneuraminate synthase n=2 Tax=Saccharospirillaceae TaxID=255527 RepID=A0ABV8BEV7_9GAMM